MRTAKQPPAGGGNWLAGAGQRVAMPGSPDHGVRAPSPWRWRMRCAEVIAAGGAVAVVAGMAAGTTLGAVAAVITVAVVLAGSLAALWFARRHPRRTAGTPGPSQVLPVRRRAWRRR
jgi:hypothetical protein